MSQLARAKACLKMLAASAPKRAPMVQYQRDPVAYAREVLGVEPWSTQREIARLMMTPPHCVSVRSSNSTGKSFSGGWLTNWFFDSFDPGIAITTAPTATAVKDVLWSQIRLQRGGRGGFRGDKLPELYSSPDHYAKGFTANSEEAFKGRHPKNMLFIIDEAVGVDPAFYRAIKTMFVPGGNHFWLMFFNPTDTSSQPFIEEQATNLDGTPAWHNLVMSSVDHPNILAGLDGSTPPIPGAVTIEQFNRWLADDTERVHAGDQKPGDLQWPPEWWCAKNTPDAAPLFYRCGPIFEASALGRWPRQAFYSVWGDEIWEKASTYDAFIPDLSRFPEIGADTARHGDDFTALHCRWGRFSLQHERHNGWGASRIAGRIKELCREMAELATKYHVAIGHPPVTPQEISVKIDGDVNGTDVIDLADGYRFISVCASSNARDIGRYPNRRSELWFDTRDNAREGKINMSGLPRDMLALLRQQFMAPKWNPNRAGQRQVEEKDETKKRLRGKSPDDADAANLAYCEASFGMAMPEFVQMPTMTPLTPNHSGGRGFFGRGR